mmetsp:Transcript_63637/g.186166  ORF Transcript_63637/g.186166 Transcript_63637/m.186166 type:complete len:210 (-) Transcript_63637:195-824(-)
MASTWSSTATSTATSGPFQSSTTPGTLAASHTSSSATAATTRAPLFTRAAPPAGGRRNLPGVPFARPPSVGGSSASSMPRTPSGNGAAWPAWLRTGMPARPRRGSTPTRALASHWGGRGPPPSTSGMGSRAPPMARSAPPRATALSSDTWRWTRSRSCATCCAAQGRRPPHARHRRRTRSHRRTPRLPNLAVSRRGDGTSLVPRCKLWP